MNITFRDKQFEKLVNDDKKLLNKFGKIRSKKTTMRLTQLMFANTLEDTRNLPGNFHELSGNRKGQWACDLDQPYRLIFMPQENPIPVNKDGGYSWMEIKGVVIIEIANYHRRK
jgi:proteic killer suppression protein